MSTANCRPTARRPSPPGLPRIPNEAALVAAWRAQADAIRARYGAVANEPVPERLKLDQVMRHDRVGGRSLGGAWPPPPRSSPSSSAAPPAGWRAALRPRRRAASTLFTADALDAYKLYVGRGAPSGRGAGQRARASDAMAVEAARLRAAHSRSCNRSGSSWSAAGCCRDRPEPRRFFMYEGPSRRALHASTAPRRPTPQTALRYKRGDSFAAVLLGRRQGRLCGERPGRPRRGSRRSPSRSTSRSTRPARRSRNAVTSPRVRGEADSVYSRSLRGS